MISEILLHGLGSFLGGDGRGDNEINTELVGDAVRFVKEFVERRSVVLADLESGIYKEIGHVMVGGKDAGNKAEQRLCIGDEILVGINEPYLILDVVLELVALFDADNASVGSIGCAVRHLDESFGLACAFYADNEFHGGIPPK